MRASKPEPRSDDRLIGTPQAAWERWRTLPRTLEGRAQAPVGGGDAAVQGDPSLCGITMIIAFLILEVILNMRNDQPPALSAATGARGTSHPAGRWAIPRPQDVARMGS